MRYSFHIFLLLVVFVILTVSCSRAKSNILLEIGAYQLTEEDYEYIRNENAERYKLSEADLEKKVVDEAYVNAYALDNGYDTVGALKKKMEYAVRFYAAVSDGFVWNKTVQPLIKVTDADIEETYKKKQKAYNIELIRIPDKKLLDKYLPSGNQIKSEADFYSVKSSVRSVKEISFVSMYQKYPFIPSEIDGERVVASKPGDTWGPFETEQGYLIIHIADIRNASVPPLGQLKQNITTELNRHRKQQFAVRLKKEIISKTNTLMFDKGISYMLSVCDIKSHRWNNVDRNTILMRYELNGESHSFTIADFIDYIENEPFYIGSLTDVEGIKNLLKNSVVDIYQYAEALKMNMLTDSAFLVFKKNRQFKIFAQYYQEQQIKPRVVVSENNVQQYYSDNAIKFRAFMSAEVLVYQFKDYQSAMDGMMPVAVKHSDRPIPEQMANRYPTVKIPEPFKTTLRFDNASYPADLKTEIMRMQPRQVSIPIAVNGEYWVVYIQSKSNLATIPYEDVKGDIYNQLREITSNKIYDEQLEELRLKYKIKINRISEYVSDKMN